MRGEHRAAGSAADRRLSREPARVLVTGGAGFIGSHTCLALRARGCDVVIVDAFIDFVPGARAAGKAVRAEAPAGLERIPVIRADLRDRAAIRDALTQVKPQAVVHLAALPLLAVANNDPRLAVAINVDGTRNLLEELAVPRTVRRFLFVSSSTIYGGFRCRSADEAHPGDPTDAYGRTKLIGEQLTRLFCSALGIGHTIVRPTAVYGPGERNRRVVQLFLEQALAGNPVTIEGDGSERLDFTYVKDLANGIVLGLLAESARDEIFNLAYGEEHTILELAGIVQRCVPGTRIVHVPSECRRPTRGALNIDRARRLLGYEPRYPLEAGIADYLALLNRRVAEAV